MESIEPPEHRTLYRAVHSKLGVVSSISLDGERGRDQLCEEESRSRSFKSGTCSLLSTFHANAYIIGIISQLLQVAYGLRYLHKRKNPVIHGDLKGVRIFIIIN